MINLKKKTLFNYKEGTSFVDYKFLSANKSWHESVLRMWFSKSVSIGMDFHFELTEKMTNKTIPWDLYYANHSIDELKANNLASKMLLMQNFIFTHEV